VLLPAIQYGDWKTVKGRMRKVVMQLKRGAGLVDVMTQDGMLETAVQPGLLVMSGVVQGPDLNFHCFLPWKFAWEPLSAARAEPTKPTAVEDAIFAAALEVPWGVLGLLAWDSQPWLYPKERHRPFLDAALAAWGELDAIGARYYWALEGKRLWAGPTGLHHVLANMGVPSEVLRAPLPPGGPSALLRYARAQS
jgi:hypothetical protein